MAVAGTAIQWRGAGTSLVLQVPVQVLRELITQSGDTEEGPPVLGDLLVHVGITLTYGRL